MDKLTLCFQSSFTLYMDAVVGSDEFHQRGPCTIDYVRQQRWLLGLHPDVSSKNIIHQLVMVPMSFLVENETLQEM